jgi:hypothetical protein
MKHLLSLVFVALFSGCAGVVVSTNEWRTVSADVEGDFSGVYVGGERGDFRSGSTFGSTYRQKAFTETWLLEKWGEPDGKQVVENQVVYLYNTGTGSNWSGVIAGVGIMVPVLVPTGRAEYYFIFEDGILKSIRYKEIEQKGAAVGVPTTN